MTTQYNPRHVPVCDKTNDIATNYLVLTLCQGKNSEGLPCKGCLDIFINAIEYDILLDN